MDAWDEYIKWDMWQQAIAELHYDTEPKEWDVDEPLPWDSVTMNVSKAYLKHEYEKAANHELTSNCSSDCDHRCGVCLSATSSSRTAPSQSSRPRPSQTGCATGHPDV